jgi:hypothetical protein
MKRERKKRRMKRKRRRRKKRKRRRMKKKKRKKKRKMTMTMVIREGPRTIADSTSRMRAPVVARPGLLQKVTAVRTPLRL